MAFFTGEHGSLELEGNKIAAVQNWSFSVNVQSVDTSSLGSTDATIIPVKRTTTGSCRILYYQEKPGDQSNTAASRFIRKISKEPTVAGTEATLSQGTAATTVSNLDSKGFSDLKLKIDDGTDQGLFVEMRILITSMTLTMSVGEICAADIQFQNNGAVKGLQF
tara:strand:- start:1373 stop:1864 length:492 start_codon:yes stop_codon:yes gene_type:complete